MHLFYHKYVDDALMRIFLFFVCIKQQQTVKIQKQITHWIVKASQVLRILVRVIEDKETKKKKKQTSTLFSTTTQQPTLRLYM